jgi:hypothetical protein
VAKLLPSSSTSTPSGFANSADPPRPGRHLIGRPSACAAWMAIGRNRLITPVCCVPRTARRRGCLRTASARVGAVRYAPRPWSVSRSGVSFCRCSADADRRFRRGQRPISVALWRASSSRSWATLSSSIERPRSRLLRRHRRHFGAATRGPCQVGRFLRNGRPRHLVVAAAELSPGPRLLVGNAGGSGALLALPPLTSEGIGPIMPDCVRCTCT